MPKWHLHCLQIASAAIYRYLQGELTSANLVRIAGVSSNQSECVCWVLPLRCDAIEEVSEAAASASVEAWSPQAGLGAFCSPGHQLGHLLWLLCISSLLPRPREESTVSNAVYKMGYVHCSLCVLRLLPCFLAQITHRSNVHSRCGRLKPLGCNDVCPFPP